MAKDKILAIIDMDDQMRYFNEDSLLEQIAHADIPNTAPIKSAYRHLATLVKEMRALQTQYFRAAHGSQEKANLLRRSKELEGKVDGIVSKYNQTINAL